MIHPTDMHACTINASHLSNSICFQPMTLFINESRLLFCVLRYTHTWVPLDSATCALWTNLKMRAAQAPTVLGTTLKRHLERNRPVIPDAEKSALRARIESIPTTQNGEPIGTLAWCLAVENITSASTEKIAAIFDGSRADTVYRRLAGITQTPRGGGTNSRWVAATASDFGSQSAEAKAVSAAPAVGGASRSTGLGETVETEVQGSGRRETLLPPATPPGRSVTSGANGGGLEPDVVRTHAGAAVPQLDMSSLPSAVAPVATASPVPSVQVEAGTPTLPQQCAGGNTEVINLDTSSQEGATPPQASGDATSSGATSMRPGTEPCVAPRPVQVLPLGQTPTVVTATSIGGQPRQDSPPPKPRRVSVFEREDPPRTGTRAPPPQMASTAPNGGGPAASSSSRPRPKSPKLSGNPRQKYITLYPREKPYTSLHGALHNIHVRRSGTAKFEDMFNRTNREVDQLVIERKAHGKWAASTAMVAEAAARAYGVRVLMYVPYPSTVDALDDPDQMLASGYRMIGYLPPGASDGIATYSLLEMPGGQGNFRTLL